MTNVGKTKQYLDWKRSNKRKKAALIGGLTVAVAGAGIGTGYAIWHNQKNATIPSTEKLVINGLQDLAVPFRSTYTYKCKDAKITFDGDKPADFDFDSNTGILTYSGGKKSVKPGSFKLRATAKDGRTTSIDVRYYELNDSDFENNGCASILNNGSVQSIETVVDANGELTLNDYSEFKNSIKAVYFKPNSKIKSIGDAFLLNCPSLTSVDLSSFNNVNTIHDSFLSYCWSLTSVDLSSFSRVTTIHDSFLIYCSSLTSVDLSSFSSVTTIGNTFLSYCSSLTSVDLSSLSSVITIGWEFLFNCSSLASIDLLSSSNLTTIGDRFLAECSSLTSIDLSPLASWANKTKIIPDRFLVSCTSLTSIDLSLFSKVTTIGNTFLASCTSLTSIDLSTLSSVTQIGESFLYGCSSLTSIDLSKLAELSENLTIGDANYCSFLTDCFGLQSIKIGSNIAHFYFSSGKYESDYKSLYGVLNRKENQILGSPENAKSFYDKIAAIYGDDESPISNWSYEGKPPV